ncbi:MAG: glycosyltransferase family 1 protein [Dehalococcoidia bacterium]|nr:MAG: glycosyltransferase family 1 protein [Dehalococcoidia bacterium]
MSSRLSIAMFSIHSCPLGQLGTRDTGGMNVYVRELSRELGRLGHCVDIYTRAHDPRDAQVDHPSENVRVIHIQAGPVEDMGKMAQYEHLPNFILNMEAFSQGDGDRYDLVHSHYWLSGSVGLRFAHQWGIPHAVMFHTLGAIKNHLPVGEAESAVRLAAEKELVDGSQRIVCATSPEKAELVRLYGAQADKISVVPCGVDTDLFKPQDRIEARRSLGLGDGKIILFIGRIEALKGIDNLVQAMSLLKPQTDARLLVIGGDEHSQAEVSRLEDMTRQLGISDAVEFLGTVAQSRLPLYYNAADVSVVASYYESFCLVILESLACGTPVLSTKVGVAPAVIRDGQNGCLVSDNNPQNLADGLAAVLDSESVDAQLIRQSVLEYDWSAIARKIEIEYQAILASKNLTQKATA